jgi:hypothetical protein
VIACAIWLIRINFLLLYFQLADLNLDSGNIVKNQLREGKCDVSERQDRGDRWLKFTGKINFDGKVGKKGNKNIDTSIARCYIRQTMNEQFKVYFCNRW